jgi:hypothetical protein
MDRGIHGRGHTVRAFAKSSTRPEQKGTVPSTEIRRSRARSDCSENAGSNARDRLCDCSLNPVGATGMSNYSPTQPTATWVVWDRRMVTALCCDGRAPGSLAISSNQQEPIGQWVAP